MWSRHQRKQHARSFGSVADVYESARPGYPAEAVAWLARPDEPRVVDVGAGTGKLTRLLVAGGHEVVAVDPSDQMLRVLRTAAPGVEALVGSGEHLPLADESADVVTFAQAWHWVDPQAASTEVARVLRPGGQLGLIWNLRDERVDWVRELGTAMRADGDQYADQMADPTVHEPFGEPDRAEFEWNQRLSRDELVELVRSRSYFAVMTADDQRRTLLAVRRVLDTHPQIVGSVSLSLPYVSLAFRYRRR